MSVPDAYRPPSPSSHRATTLPGKEVHLPPLVTLAPLSNFVQQGTIGKLSDYTILTIFGYYLDASPRFWPRLVHVCRRWRRIVFASQRTLRLRLFCTPGTPVPDALYFWPALPIVVQYGGSLASYPPAPEDEDNIVVALKQSDRVSSISLTITNSLLEKLSAIERPFSELENLVLLCGDDVPLTLSSAFRWGPRLRTLHLTRANILALPQLLFFSTGLVDLQLHEISDVGYISPEAFANALSGMSHLRTLSLRFLSSAPYPVCVGLPPHPSELVVLPALRSLKYRGTSKYLDSLADRIDAPRLGNIDITFFSQPPPTEPPQLGRFINRIARQKSPCRADILFSKRAISISFTQPESPACLHLQVSCNQSFSSFSRQLSYMAWICNGLHSFLFGIEHLRICATRPTSDHDYNGFDWHRLLRFFKGLKWAYVACGASTNLITTLLCSETRRETLLPALHKLCLQKPDPLSQKAVESFIHSRWLSSYIIMVEYERLSINGLHGTGTTSYHAMFYHSLMYLEQVPFFSRS
jgi:hypothetical protein